MSDRPGTANRPLRAAIVGAGPAGFFTTEALLKQPALVCTVDLIERLPTPYGLVRDGVAPDHPSIKKVAERFARIAESPAVRFFGNVTFGLDLTHRALLRLYDVVVYATGAPSDRQLHIPGEDLLGSWPATAFVGWYNGHPDYAGLEFDLTGERAVVVGNGNVAVDVARILCRRPSDLEVTDIADHALRALRESRVREVVMLGRRGPAQAKFTPTELKELGRLPGVSVDVRAGDLQLDPDSGAVLKRSRSAARNYELLKEMAARRPVDAARRLVLRFYSSPVELVGRDGRVVAVRIERNRLVTDADGYQRARGTGVFETLEAGLVFRSVGYRGVALPDVPFDIARGVIPNRAGRVIGPNGEVCPGEYVAGWIKRGPTGVIGTNKADAAETVRSVLEDLDAGRVPGAPQGGNALAEVERLLERRGVRRVSFEEWRMLDEAERGRGERMGRPRVKFVSVDEMLRAIDSRVAAGGGGE